jgi:chemotaxis protein MotB
VPPSRRAADEARVRELITGLPSGRALERIARRTSQSRSTPRRRAYISSVRLSAHDTDCVVGGTRSRGDPMRRVMFVVGIAALIGCAGVSKEQYSAKEAEAAKYKQAVQDESAKSGALESKVKSLEQENEGLQQKLTEASAAQSQLKELQGRTPLQVSSERLLFKENSSKLTPEATHALDAIAQAVSQVKDKSIMVVGFTDNSEAAGKDSKAKRWQLSSARALAVAKYLSTRGGIDPMRIAVAGFGEARPIAPNDTLANKALNRRAEIALTPTSAQFGTAEVKPAEIKTK